MFVWIIYNFPLKGMWYFGGVVNRVQFTQLFSHNYNHFEKMNWEKVLVFANEGLKSINFLNN